MGNRWECPRAGSRFGAKLSAFFQLLLRPHGAIRLIAALSITGAVLSLPANALVSPTAQVGATPGSFAVSPSGAATYTIPIIVAPGVNGMQPNLALVYNSQGSNGLLGMGWALSGLSVIHRCGATIELDGFKGGVNYDANDRFCLDGDRLIRVGTSTEYRTEKESLQKVQAADTTTKKIAVSELKKYVGDYVLQSETRTLEVKIFVEDGCLKAHPAGQPVGIMKYIGNHRFKHERNPDIQISFTLEKGVASKMTLYQRGIQVDGKKKG